MQHRILIIGNGDDAAMAARAVVAVGMEALVIGEGAFPIADDRVTYKDGWTLKHIEGQIGAFEAVFDTSDGEQTETVSSIIAATGADMVPCSLMNSAGDKAVSFKDLPALLNAKEYTLPMAVVFIQDADVDDGQWVSAIGINLARQVRKMWGCDVYYLCRFIRGSHFEVENAYRMARAEGVVFIKYSKDSLAVMPAEGKTTVSFNDYTQEISIQADMVVMSDVLKPQTQTSSLTQKLGIGINHEGFFQYDNAYYPFTATNRRGVYVIGACKGPAGLNDVSGDAAYTALDIKIQLDELRPIADVIAEINLFKCSLCLTCLRFCPHGALHVSDDMPSMVVYDMACQGCGICGAVCPAEAINLADNGKALMKESSGQKRLKVYCCKNSAKKALDAINMVAQLPQGVELAEMPCSGSIKPEELVNDIYAGFQRILILACYSDACRHVNGNADMRRQMKALQDTLADMGIARDSIVVMDVAGPSSDDVLEKINSAYNAIGLEVAL
ncbi:MAG: hypothetical protein PWP48_880 [Clostridiales bacterium]|jgi:heterodisulfide reductase subunit A|nr:hypothetical protein [Clostridiales bacterium]